MARKTQGGRGGGSGGNPSGRRQGGKGGGSGGRSSRGPGGGAGQVGICFDFKKTGTCRFGRNCKFKHVGQSNGPSGNQKPAQRVQKPKDSSAYFIRHLAALPNAKIGMELATRGGQWESCWKQHASLDGPSISLLIEVLARMPGSSSADPPPLSSCEHIFIRYLDGKAKATASDDAVLTAVKTVSDALTRLFCFEWTESQDAVKDVLRNVTIAAEDKLRKRREDHREVASSLLDIMRDLDKPWRIKVRSFDTTGETESDINEVQDMMYSGWKTATVKWLVEPSFFAPACCPIMKVGQRGCYDNPEDYMNTVHKLWVAMTFFDGFAAIAPRCRCKGHNGTCSNALWPVAAGNCHTADLKCRKSGCTQPVLFSCRNKSHDAMCERCAKRTIAENIGPPGSRSSTHIYDAKVRSIRSDGVLYLENFKSRNPPEKPVHWRSTKRLSPPNLVGIVRVRNRGCALSTNDAILWGEVACTGQFRDESRRRENGECYQFSIDCRHRAGRLFGNHGRGHNRLHDLRPRVGACVACT